MRYRTASGTDITQRVTGGTYQTPSVAQGGTFTVKITVTMARSTLATGHPRPSAHGDLDE